MSARLETIALPPVQTPAEGKLGDLRSAFATAEEIALRQAWHRKPERDFQPGTVQAAWCPRFVHVLATLTDGDIVVGGEPSTKSSLAVSDVFQIFAERDGHGDYIEVHVTPDNRTRVIGWTPDRFAAFRDGEITIDEILCDDCPPPVSRTWVEKENSCWTAYLRLPVDLLAFAEKAFRPEHSFRATFCRFDASPGTVAPVVSSTSAFPDKPRFHDSRHWHRVALVQ